MIRLSFWESLISREIDGRRRYEYPDWNAPISRKEFWKQHELWRVNKHFHERQHFIDYKHEQLLLKCCVVAFISISGYLLFGTYSFQDNSARVYKVCSEIVKQSPIVRNLIGPHVFCFGTCGFVKKYPYYFVTPVDELGNCTVMYMRFNVAGTSGRGVVELHLRMEGSSNRSVKVEKFTFSPSIGESWELKRPGTSIQTLGFI